jgi:hypothetical protein
VPVDKVVDNLWISMESANRVKSTAEALRFAMERKFDPVLIVHLIARCVLAIADNQVELGNDTQELGAKMLKTLDELLHARNEAG